MLKTITARYVVEHTFEVSDTTENIEIHWIAEDYAKDNGFASDVKSLTEYEVLNDGKLLRHINPWEDQ